MAMSGMNTREIITMAAPLDGSVLVTHESTAGIGVESPTTLTAEQAAALAKAIIWGTAHIDILQSATAATPAFTLTALEFSIDGTNYATLKTFDTAVTCSTTDGQKALVSLNGYDQCCDDRITKVRFVMGGSAPDGTNKCKLTCKIVCYAP
jgi:hypothetical protein